jgi:hypothetical protein
MLVREAGLVLGPGEVPGVDADALCAGIVSMKPLIMDYKVDTHA